MFQTDIFYMIIDKTCQEIVNERKEVRMKFNSMCLPPRLSFRNNFRSYSRSRSRENFIATVPQTMCYLVAHETHRACLCLITLLLVF